MTILWKNCPTALPFLGLKHPQKGDEGEVLLGLNFFLYFPACQVSRKVNMALEKKKKSKKKERKKGKKWQLIKELNENKLREIYWHIRSQTISSDAF